MAMFNVTVKLLRFHQCIKVDVEVHIVEMRNIACKCSSVRAEDF